MRLSAGTRLGRYEIQGPLGSGGMGEVYKAADTRLNRTVAIKVLPDTLAADPQFRQRFDGEAHAISQLDHPHICTLYDVGQEGGTSYLVMQYLEGETLAARLDGGPLPLDQAVQYATQIADALATAHRSGVIHRDLKPANIMLTKSGARLLDFGLARSTPAVTSTARGVSVETTPARLTAQGTIIGTFQYMAPEQIEGRDVDARADIWGFGCVLYEMLGGKPPFAGKSPASLLAHILSGEPPPLRDARPSVPRLLDRITQRCLAKDPDDRWQSMADVRHALRWTPDDANAATAAVAPRWRRAVVYAGALLLALAAGAAIPFIRSTEPRAVPPVKATFLPPAGLTFTPFGSNGTPHFALSPDGKRIAFVAAAAGRPPSLWVRALDSRVAQPVPDSNDAASPFWSPDSSALGFFAEGRVKTIALNGERPKVLATIFDAAGGAWSDDVILVGRGAGPVVRIPATGGPVKDATVVRPGRGGHRWPQFLPDGRRFIYTESRGSVMLAALDAPGATELRDGRATAVYAQGHLLFFQRASLVAQAVDAKSLAPIGAPRELLDDVRYAGGSGSPPVSVSTGGVLAYWDGTTVSTAPRWVDRSGRAVAAAAPGSGANPFAISPTDGRVVYGERAGPGPVTPASLWMMDPSGATSRFSFNAGGAARPIWSPDGRQILYTANDEDRIVLFRRPADGGEREVEIGNVNVPAGVGGFGNYYASDWSNDGRTALLSITEAGTSRDVVAISLPSNRVTPLFHADAYEVQARFSTDNRWIAYATNDTGRWEVVVEPFPVSGQKWQISNGGGSQPVWGRDGKELFYVAADGQMMSVRVESGASFRAGTPQPLFASNMRPTYAPYPHTYDVAPDGQRFLIDAVQPGTGPTISVVVNWAAASRQPR